jgi:hypothetical protein
MKYIVVLSNVQSNEFKQKYQEYEQSYQTGCYYLIPQPYISTSSINGTSYSIDI